MIRLMLLEWREVARDMRSWIIALLPLLFFTVGRTLDLYSGASVTPGGTELFHFGLPVLMLQTTLIADLLAQQRARGELELLWLLPLSPLKLLSSKLLAILLPTLLLLTLQIIFALFLFSKLQISFSLEDLLWPLATLYSLTFAFGSWGAQLALSTGTLRRSVSRLFLLLLALIIAVEFAELCGGAIRWVVPPLLLAIALLKFRLLVIRWNHPATWLGNE